MKVRHTLAYRTRRCLARKRRAYRAMLDRLSAAGRFLSERAEQDAKVRP